MHQYRLIHVLSLMKMHEYRENSQHHNKNGSYEPIFTRNLMAQESSAYNNTTNINVIKHSYHDS